MVSLFANDMPRGCLPVAIRPVCQVGWNPEGHPSSYLYATCRTTCLCTPANTRQPYSNPCSSHVSTKSCESRDGQTCRTKRASPQSWIRSRCSLLRGFVPVHHVAIGRRLPFREVAKCQGRRMSGLGKSTGRCRRPDPRARHAGGQRKMGGEYYVDTI